MSNDYPPNSDNSTLVTLAVTGWILAFFLLGLLLGMGSAA
jgi:hypothetical protein